MGELTFPGLDAEAPGDFAYGAPAALRPNLAIYADRAALRGELRDDALEAGYRIARAEPLDALVDGEPRPLGDVVFVDCPVADGAVMAALARLDMRAARTGATLIVSTSLAALDAVFGCLDQSQPQLLVAAGRSDRLIALGQAMARHSAGVRELSDADRAVLLRLSEQVSAIGAQLETLKGTPAAPEDLPEDLARLAHSPSAFRFTGGKAASGHSPALSPPALPPAALVRGVIRQRQLRARHLPADLFADPAWDMLLDLTAAHVEQVRVSVSSLCIASGVPATTALRWIAQLTEAGLLRREEDPADRRRAFLALSEQAIGAMAGYFSAVARDPAPLL